MGRGTELPAIVPKLSEDRLRKSGTWRHLDTGEVPRYFEAWGEIDSAPLCDHSVSVSLEALREIISTRFRVERTSSSRFQAIEERLQDIELRLDDIQGLALPESIDEYTAFDWIGDNPEALDRHTGMAVAIHPTKGIVESAGSIPGLYEGISRREDRRELLIYLVEEDE